tara:strand:- start:8435 stop:8881 length:447 start_codon:yes stop_codon:yes gene_type:complete
MSLLRKRQKARRLLVQALYSWDLAGDNAGSIETHLRSENDFAKVDSELFHSIFLGVVNDVARVDGAYEPYLDRDQHQLDPISKAILRISTFELVNRVDVPFKVVINEAINLAKTFGPADAFKFVNAVLEGVAENFRGPELLKGSVRGG